MRCDVSEAHEVTLSRFRAGLREDIKRELFLREVTDLDQAYQIALNSEKFQRGPMPSRVSAPILRNGPSQVIPSKPSQGIPTPKPMDEGKAPDTQRTPSITCFKCQKPGHISSQCTAIACFKCHKIGHVSSQCPHRSLYIEEGEEENSRSNEEFEEEVYEAGMNLVDEYEREEESTESDQLGVVRCILSQSRVQEDWHRTNILQTFLKLEDKVCKIIIDSGSCVNAIFASTVKMLGLTPVPHPNPYKVSWVDSTSIPIQSRCQVQIQMQSYQEKIWCDVLPMGVSSIILGRPWLYDHDATLLEKFNTCVFSFNGKKITIHSVPPKDKVAKGPNKVREMKTGVNLISAKDLE